MDSNLFIFLLICALTYGNLEDADEYKIDSAPNVAARMEIMENQMEYWTEKMFENMDIIKESNVYVEGKIKQLEDYNKAITQKNVYLEGRINELQEDNKFDGIAHLQEIESITQRNVYLEEKINQLEEKFEGIAHLQDIEAIQQRNVYLEAKMKETEEDAKHQRELVGALQEKVETLLSHKVLGNEEYNLMTGEVQEARMKHLEKLGNIETAFTAFESTEITEYQEGDKIKFQNDRYNAGQNYDAENSQYVCPATGIYWFSFSLLADSGEGGQACLMLDDSEWGGVLLSADNSNMGSSIAILQCNLGQRVWIKCKMTGSHIWGNVENNYVSVFTGAMLSLL